MELEVSSNSSSWPLIPFRNAASRAEKPPPIPARVAFPARIQDGAGAEVDLLLAQRYRMLNKVCKGF